MSRKVNGKIHFAPTLPPFPVSIVRQSFSANQINQEDYNFFQSTLECQFNSCQYKVNNILREYVGATDHFYVLRSQFKERKEKNRGH